MQNDMRDRLTEYIESAKKLYEGDVTDLLESEYIAECILSDGVIVPPCKVGDTLYLVQIDWEGKYFLTTCAVESKITMLSILRSYEEKTVVYMSTDKEQAEQKLKEMRSGNDRKALDKMSKLKPIRANRLIKKNGMFILNEDNEYWKCPVCTKVDVVLLENQEHCDCCGQTIDWEGV